MRKAALRVAVIALVAVSAVAYAGLEKRITVRVDGAPRAVRTFAFSVEDALHRAGISIGQHDEVRPGLGARLGDGAVIDVLRAKPIVLLLDGKPRRVLVTGLTVAEVIRDMNLRRASLADYVKPHRAARVEAGMTIVYRRAVGVTVLYDGRKEQVITNATSVGDVLRELGVRLRKRDKLRPQPDVRPKEGMTIKVLRVGFVTETVERPIPFLTRDGTDRSLEYGLKRSIEGRRGLRRLVYRSKYEDGRRVSRSLISTKVVRPPRHRGVLRGMWFPKCSCDAGSQQGDATWFEARGLTAAHRTLPMGTVVRVTNRSNGKSVNVIVRDRGPFAEGRIIDLSHHAFRRLAPLGTGVLDVQIRW